MSEPTEFDGEIPDKMFFRIGEAAGLVGVETHVLRYWEGEFKVRPQRSKSGQRMYRRKDIATFMRIRRLLHDQGFTIAGARKALKGGGEGNATAASGADPKVFEQALTRISGVRQRIAAARKRFAHVVVAEDAADG